jgi:sugar phosphate permease
MPKFFSHCNTCDLSGNNNTCLEIQDENMFQVCLLACSESNEAAFIVLVLVILLGTLIFKPQLLLK